MQKNAIRKMVLATVSIALVQTSFGDDGERQVLVTTRDKRTVNITKMQFTQQDNIFDYGAGVLTVRHTNGRATGVAPASMLGIVFPGGNQITLEYVGGGKTNRISGTYDERYDQYSGFHGESSFGGMYFKFNELASLRFTGPTSEPKSARMKTTPAVVTLTSGKTTTLADLEFNQHESWSSRRAAMDLGPGAYEVVGGSGIRSHHWLSVSIGGFDQTLSPPKLRKVDTDANGRLRLTAEDGATMPVDTASKPLAGVNGIDETGTLVLIPVTEIRAIEFVVTPKEKGTAKEVK